MSRTRSQPGSYKPRLLRPRIAARDGACCFYCRRPFDDLAAATLDHYVPFRLWRTWLPANLVLACDPCNQAKADTLPLPLAWLLLHTVQPTPTLARAA